MRVLSIAVAILAFSLCFVSLARAVDHKKFRTCKQTPFCDRHRGDKFQSEEYALSGVTTTDTGVLEGFLQSSQHPNQPQLAVTVSVLTSGAVRVQAKEATPLVGRYEVRDVLLQEALDTQPVVWTESGGVHKGVYGANELVIDAATFVVTLSVDGEEAIRLNGNRQFDFEQHRPKGSEGGDYWPEVDGMWETSFDKHTDHIKNGPATIAMDTAFLGSKHLYGIPEHATTFVLKNTDGTDGGYDEPYRLWNLDVFEFDLDVPMALYGAVPLIVSHSATHTNAVLWLNAAETYVDISDYDAQSKQTHWISETGNLDVFLFPGPTPAAVFEQYTTLTGTPALPQEFAVAYHQCRWNYKNEDDVSAVDNGFDDHDIPYDVLWLDIEHTNDKMYFTWDKNNFPTPQKMQNALSEKGRKMVTIVDPHIKRKDSYHIHKQAKNKFYVTDKEGKDFDGWCWPGSSSYLDFIRPDVRGFWAEQFSLANYEGSTPSLYTWNDMNEPSVFNGPEVTMPKDCLHDNGLVEHREVHNQYGFYQQMATEKGQADRGGRPFVLSRSFFAGSQRYGAIWTGDNMATWEHHESTVPMLLALGTGGIVFSGADVGGFFGDPDAELLTRWYQAAAFQPFFRGHAHIDTKRREPWVFGEHYTSIIRDAIRRRYAMMPYVYTTFQQASVSGFPVMRALWHEFPALESTFAVEDEFLLGGALLVKPVTQAGQKTTTVQLPMDATTDVWYDYTTYAPVTQASVEVDVSDLSTLVAYYRGGYIVPLKLRPRRASALMANDPYTLVIALNGAQEASGTLYLDDGASYDYLAQKHTTLKFQFTDNTLSSSVAGVAGYDDGCSIERLIVLGLKKDVTAVTQANGQALQFTQDGTVLTVKKPGVGTSAPFSISFA